MSKSTIGSFVAHAPFASTHEALVQTGLKQILAALNERPRSQRAATR
jgi:hypothetical protein